jgi:hypothetical protein
VMGRKEKEGESEGEREVEERSGREG